MLKQTNGNKEHVGFLGSLKGKKGNMERNRKRVLCLLSPDLLEPRSNEANSEHQKTIEKCDCKSLEYKTVEIHRNHREKAILFCGFEV